MRTIEVKQYQYDELSDEAKTVARDWWREAGEGDIYWSEPVMEDFLAVCDLLGVDIGKRRGDHGNKRIYWSGFSSQGDGASFEGSYRYKEGSVEAIKQHAPNDKDLHIIAESLFSLQMKYDGELMATITTSSWAGNYSNSHTMDVETLRGDDEEADENVSREVRDLMRALADWFYKQLESAYNAEQEDENVVANIEANEFWFLESGHIA
jgi:hypothetical protein